MPALEQSSSLPGDPDTPTAPRTGERDCTKHSGLRQHRLFLLSQLLVLPLFKRRGHRARHGRLIVLAARRCAQPLLSIATAINFIMSVVSTGCRFGMPPTIPFSSTLSAAKAHHAAIDVA